VRHTFVLDNIGSHLSICCTAAQEGKHLVVIGSSFIGMEVAATVASRKLASINVVGRDEYPFQSVLGLEIGKGLKQVRST
jgi:hypothetical protein